MPEFINEHLADDRSAVDSARDDKRPRTGGDPYDYMFEDYNIRERFSPDGPTFEECIVSIII